MIKLFIICSNFNELKKLVNSVIGGMSKVKIVGISEEINDLYNRIEENDSPNMVIFLNRTPSKFLKSEYNGGDIKVISIIKSSIPIQRFDDHIVLSRSAPKALKIKEISDYTEEITIDTIRKKLSETLRNLGFNFKMVGTHYLIDTVLYSFSNRFTYSFENLEKEVFPYVANKNKTQIQNVKWSLNRTVDNMYYNHTTKSFVKVADFFCIEPTEKPTTKLIIGILVTKLNNEFSDFNQSII